MRLRHLAVVAGIAAVFAIGPSSAGAVAFSGPTDYVAGEAPESVAVGDFDGDSNLDLAVANNEPSGVSILLGTSAGGFSAPVSFAAGSGPTAVAVADFDGDSNLDLAVANVASDNVSILLGNGDGSFAAAANFGAGEGPQSVAVGDFDGDSNLDLAVANFVSDSVSILLGDGDGGFGAPNNIGTDDRATSVAVGEFNGDSDLDLAVANDYGDNVSILLGIGDGDFTGPTNIAVGIEPHSVAVADFDGDSKADLAVANSADNNVSILLGHGDGTFGAATNFGVGAFPFNIAVGNLNGDSDPDLAVANFSSDNVSVLLGAAGGGFSSPTNFAAGSAPTGVAIGDFNGGPRLDLAVANFGSDDVSILLGQAETALSTQATATATAGGLIADEATLSGGFTATGSITFSAYGPDDATCAGTPAFTATTPVAGNGAYDSPNFTPTEAGTYRWVASYSGDANNTPVTGACGDAGETSTVSAALPTIAATASAGVGLGGQVHDAATLAGGVAPSGDITFSLYGPDDAGCSGTPVFSDAVAVDSGNGVYESPEFTPARAGTYRWIASYSGDSNNGSVATACGDAGASVSVAKAATTTTLGAAPKPSLLGQAVAFTATVAGHAPTGTVIFKEGASTLGTAPLDADGRATLSISSLPAGAHSVTAVYGGDAGNAESTSAPLVAQVDSPPPSPSPSPSPGPLPSLTLTYSPNHPHAPNPAGGPRYTFRFSDPAPGVAFYCRLDKRPFKPCASPKVYRNLKRGRHVFQVKSVYATGAESAVQTVRFAAAKPRR